MPLFICDKCDCIENTSSGYYWTRGTGKFNLPEDNQALCSLCAPSVDKNGKATRWGSWHGDWERRVMTEEAVLKYKDSNLHFSYLGKFEYLRDEGKLKKYGE